jgi:hypothetical protein
LWTTVIALSLEAPMAEEAFLRRELGIEWRTVDIGEIRQSLRSQATTLVLCSDPHLYTSILGDAPHASAMLFLISDEEYTDARTNLAQLPAVRHVYRQYPARPVPLRSLPPALRAFVQDAHASSHSARIAGTLVKQGLSTRRRMKKWLPLGEKLTNVPLGYTNAFEEQWLELNQGPRNDDGSLFGDVDDTSDRSLSVTFLGHRGQAQRVMGLDRAASLPASDIRIVDGIWSGFAHEPGESDYVKLLLTSRFALCPPGFVNGETFRYYEALICGALPIEIHTALTHLGIVLFRPVAWKRQYSWTASLRAATNLDEVTRVDLVQQSRNLVRKQLNRIRLKLNHELEIL